jgi:small-conductance mechanosensitive channel
MEKFDAISQYSVMWLSKATGISPGLYNLLFSSLACIAILWSLRWLILKLVRWQTDDLQVLYQWRRISGYAVFVLIVMLVGRVCVEGFHNAATFLGLLAAGLAISFRDPLVNLVGWMFLLWWRPFAVGDRIQIGSHAGDVMDLTTSRFTLGEIGNWAHADQITGRIVHIPNGKVFAEPVAIYSKGMHDFIWNEVAVLVTFESNWKKAKDILNEIAVAHAGHLAEPAESKLREYARDFLIGQIDLAPKVFTTVEANGILLTVRHLCRSRHRRESTQEIWEGVLDRFAECDDVDFAYRTTRSHNNVTDASPPDTHAPERLPVFSTAIATKANA